MTASFAVLGHVFIKRSCEGAALLLGFVTGPMMEEDCRRSLRLSCGDFSVLLTWPISPGLLLAATLTVIVALQSIKSRREEAFQEWLA